MGSLCKIAPRFSLFFTKHKNKKQIDEGLLIETVCFCDRQCPFSSPVVVGNVRPPVGLGLDIAQNHVLDGGGQAWHLPGNVGLPAAPRLAQVLQDRATLVSLDALGHHVQDVVHHRCIDCIHSFIHSLAGSRSFTQRSSRERIKVSSF